MAHQMLWQDDKMVGYHCDKDPAARGQSGSLDAEERPAQVCEYCGKTLTLRWTVIIEESPDAP